MIIDAHQHVWDLERASYPWLDSALAPIDRTLQLDDVLPQMRAAGVSATVLVQAADNAEDTANMLRVADEHPEVVGVVAWIPLDRPTTAAGMLESLRGDDRVVGVRTLLHTYADTRWILRPEVGDGLALLTAAGMPFDYVVGGPAALSLLPSVSERHPELSIVVDHLGKPPINGTADEHARWRAMLAEAAENPRVTAKISGLYSSTGSLADWTPASVRPFVLDALEIFGPQRLMVGGDWPISVLAGGYERTWSLLTAVAGELDRPSGDALLGGTAAAVYGLDVGRLRAAS